MPHGRPHARTCQVGAPPSFLGGLLQFLCIQLRHLQRAQEPPTSAAWQQDQSATTQQHDRHASARGCRCLPAPSNHPAVQLTYLALHAKRCNGPDVLERFRGGLVGLGKDVVLLHASTGSNQLGTGNQEDEQMETEGSSQEQAGKEWKVPRCHHTGIHKTQHAPLTLDADMICILVW